MSATITATDGSGSFDAFVVTPQGSGPHGAVVLIQEIFGVNESMRETARQVAAMGFVVLVPDLFWRQRAGVDLTDRTEAEWKEALALMHAFDQDKGIEDLKATAWFEVRLHVMLGWRSEGG
jgi:carboxymethylenebutenolidase